MNAPAVLLFRGRGLVSWLIRFQTRGHFAHAALLMRDGRIIESYQGAGVRVKPFTVGDTFGITAFDVVGMTDEQWTKAIDFAMSEIGRGYDYWAVVRFIDRQKMPDNDKWMCSELIFAALQHAGVNLLERVEAWAVSPEMLSYSPLLNCVGRDDYPQ